MLRSKTEKPIEYGFAPSCTFYMFAVVVTLVCQGAASVIAAALAKISPDIASNSEFNTACMIVFQLANFAFIVLYTRLKNNKPNFSYFKRGDEGVKPSHIVVPVLAAAARRYSRSSSSAWADRSSPKSFSAAAKRIKNPTA